MICCPNELVRLSGGHRQGGQMLSLAVSLISVFCLTAFDCSFSGSLAMKTKKYFPFHHTHDEYSWDVIRYTHDMFQNDHLWKIPVFV